MIPATVIEFANIVKIAGAISITLMLLTLADGQGTTETWSDWKELLVWQLYHATSRYLQDQEGFIAQIKIERDRLRDCGRGPSSSPDFADEIEAHFDYMPDHYFRAFDVEEIVAHLDLFRELLARYLSRTTNRPSRPPLRWEAQPEQGHSVVSLCTWDRLQLLDQHRGRFRGRVDQHPERRYFCPRRQPRARCLPRLQQQAAGR